MPKKSSRSQKNSKKDFNMRRVNPAVRSRSVHVNGHESETESVCDSVSGMSIENSVDYNDDTSDYESDKEFKEETMSRIHSQLDDFIELLNDKSAQQRILGFRKISDLIINYYVPEYISTNRFTICDEIKRGLRRGDDDEQVVAANLVPLLCVQLGAEFNADELVLEIKPILTKIFQDPSKSFSVRAKCCTALSLLTFLAGNDMAEVIKTIGDITHEIILCFTSSHSKITQSTFYVTALSSWNLLLSILEANHVHSLFEVHNSYVPSIDRFSYVLSSEYVDVRLESGQSLAIIYEIGRTHSVDFGQAALDDLLPIVNDLAKVSHKHRGKKEQKTQRITFRIIEDFLERNIEVNANKVKFGGDVVILNSWCSTKQYQHVCDLLGSGLNQHMAKNRLIRNIFNLGDPLSEDQKCKIKKSSKLEKNLMNAATSKARTISRNKARGKRTDDFETF